MPRTRVHDHGEALASRPGYRLLLGLDLIVLVGLLVLAIRWLVAGDGVPAAFAWGVVAWALVTMATTVRSLGLWAGAMVWRRRLALVAIMGVLARGSPLATSAWQVPVVLWGAVLWIALLSEGRRVSLAVADATGEEVLGADPDRPDR